MQEAIITMSKRTEVDDSDRGGLSCTAKMSIWKYIRCLRRSVGCKQRISCLNNRCNCTHPVTGGEEEVCCRYVDRFVVLRYVVWAVYDFKCCPQYCNCNLLLPCCVCALFLDLIMADVGLLNDQRILKWS